MTSHQARLAMVRHLAATARPAIVIAGSGMCSSGRIVNYLKAMLHDTLGMTFCSSVTRLRVPQGVRSKCMVRVEVMWI